MLVKVYLDQPIESIKESYEKLIDRSLSLKVKDRSVHLIQLLLNYFQNGNVPINYDEKADVCQYKFTIENNLLFVAGPMTITMQELRKRIADSIKRAYYQVFLDSDEDQLIVMPETVMEVQLFKPHPKDYLSQKFEKLFAFLDGTDVPGVWDLLNLVPTNKEMETRFQRMEVDWETLFNESFYHVLYYLKSIQKLVLQPNWMMKFKQNGLKVIIDYFLKQNYT